MNDAAFKSGTVLIEEGMAYFKFDKFYDRLKAKNYIVKQIERKQQKIEKKQQK